MEPASCNCDFALNQVEAASQKLYDFIPRHRSQIEWYDLGHWTTWMLFGNDDDGIFGEGREAQYLVTKKANVGKALRWQLRNPLHNFCFYVIGSAYRENSEITLLEISPERFCCLKETWPPKNFPSQRSCFFFALHGGKPFIAFQLVYSKTYRAEFYLGWRDRGNFGLKFLPFKKIAEP